jgi:DNA-binding MurR/RpiR family transcriptional regulator
LRALGFEGYPQFRTELVRGFEATLAPVERLRDELARPTTAAEVFAASLEDGIRNLEATRRALDPEACERAVSAILEAERVYVMGFGASGFLAGLLQHGLEMHCRMVTSVSTWVAHPMRDGNCLSCNRRIWSSPSPFRAT